MSFLITYLKMKEFFVFDDIRYPPGSKQSRRGATSQPNLNLPPV